ncbi:MAG: sigma-54-dependent Fis family transcriptional regulator [Xanthomonadaceae bacterium]|nr:sigma-54-dependent Fis family transcriptional regulator [Xanthomonadaceae bacterium]
MRKTRVLLLEDNAIFGTIVKKPLEAVFDLKWVRTLEETREELNSSHYDIFIIDRYLENDKIGFDIIPEIRAKQPRSVILAFTSDDSPVTIMDALAKGATDYLVKSHDTATDIIPRIMVAQTRVILELELKKAQQLVKSDSDFEIIGNSKSSRELKEQIELFGPTEVNVLIQGETGTGKELIAKQLNAHGKQSLIRPFITQNCANLSDQLFESELFGHKRGAFTGAVSDKIGKIELANDGDLFLDEIGDLSLSTQAKLLRVLESGEYYRVGNTKPSFVKVRIIAASHKNLESLVDQKLFREDLLFRLNSVVLHTTPLRERTSEIPVLAQYFADKESNGLIHIPEKVMKYLKDEPWRGNARELKHKIQAACIIAKSQNRLELDLSDFSKFKRNPDYGVPGLRIKLDGDDSLSEIIHRTKSLVIDAAIMKCNGDTKKAADLLKVHRSTIYEVKSNVR